MSRRAHLRAPQLQLQRGLRLLHLIHQDDELLDLPRRDLRRRQRRVAAAMAESVRWRPRGRARIQRAAVDGEHAASERSGSAEKLVAASQGCSHPTDRRP